MKKVQLAFIKEILVSNWSRERELEENVRRQSRGRLQITIHSARFDEGPVTGTARGPLPSRPLGGGDVGASPPVQGRGRGGRWHLRVLSRC